MPPRRSTPTNTRRRLFNDDQKTLTQSYRLERGVGIDKNANLNVKQKDQLAQQAKQAIIKESTIKPEPKQEQSKDKVVHLDPNDPKYVDALASATQATVPPIHQEEYTAVDKLLRKFDLTADYGPAAGLSRLQRWQRAEKLGRHPPAIIKAILETHEGRSEIKYSQPYMYGYV